MGSAIPIKMPPWRNRPQERFRIRRRILLLTSVHSVPARSCPIFSGVFSGKTRRMHIQYQRYPAGVAHEIFKVRCDFVRNQEFSEVKPKVNRSVWENSPYTLYKLKGGFLNRVFWKFKENSLFSMFPSTYNILKWVFGNQFFKFCWTD